MLVGLLNAPGLEKFNDWVAFHVPGVEEIVEHHEFNPSLALISLAVVLAGIGIAWRAYAADGWPRGLMARSSFLANAHRILVNKYYLDDLFIDGIIGTIQYPIARAAYWVNQNVIDGVVNGVGIGSAEGRRVRLRRHRPEGRRRPRQRRRRRRRGGWQALRKTQTGRVQQYAAFLFGASALLAVGLVFLT